MRIGIVGAGAIGGWIGVTLAAQGHAVSVFARGATREALRSRPWQLAIDGKLLEAKVAASDRADELGTQDILMIALKGPALGAVAQVIGPMIGHDTIVIPAMNGVPWWFLLGGGGMLPPTAIASVDPDGSIAKAIPFSALIGCVVHASAHVAEPGRVVHSSGKRLIFGEPNGALSPRLELVAGIFAQAGFDAVRSDHIRQDIWYKLWGNMTMNPISALTGATCDRILDDPLVNALVLRVMVEAKEIGGRIGCSINERGEDRVNVTRKLGAIKTSMLQDVEAGRAMEIDQLLAAPREIARLVSVPTPNIDALLGLTRLFAASRGLS